MQKIFQRKIKLLNKDIRKYKLKNDLIISYYTLIYISINKTRNYINL